MKEKFYLTTAIAYTSSKPHIGNVYEAILADCIVRYKKKAGFDTYFQTGTDEHGQKIEQKANLQGIKPKEHVDNISNQIKEIYKLMNIEYDHFIRTTDIYHEEEVQKAFEKLLKQGDIYKGMYEGNYCVSCESFFTEKDLVDGCCPDCGSKVTRTKEESYFFKLTPYQDKLVKYINDHPDFIQPESRKNEMLNNFLAKPLPDLCVSRTSYKWGIPVTSDPKHVIYVWIDALLNYITGIGYHVDGKSDDLFNKYWPCDIHLIGKDILRFHTIYWPIMLMALGLELPKQVFGHPWVLTNHNKMSKSKGNVLYADDLVKIFGVDVVRYYCLHEIPFASDGNLTYELIIEKSNTDLANTLGNLVNRTIAMVNKYFNDSIYFSKPTEFDVNLVNIMNNSIANFYNLMDKLRVGDAIEEVMILLRASNKYIDETTPWVLAKDESKKENLRTVLYNLLEAIRLSAIMLEMAIPNTSKKIYSFLNIKDIDYTNLVYKKVTKYSNLTSEVLFKRFDVKEIMDEVVAKENQKEELKEEIKKVDEITIDDFNKVSLVVGKIIEANKHPKADKLLVFKVDIKFEVRQIVSGIAAYYDPKDLVGKKVIVVKNLKPITLRGVESCGMLLCASNKDKLELIEIKDLNPGDIVC